VHRLSPPFAYTFRAEPPFRASAALTKHRALGELHGCQAKAAATSTTSTAPALTARRARGMIAHWFRAWAAIAPRAGGSIWLVTLVPSSRVDPRRELAAQKASHFCT
jgi:hypothetical protein